MCVRERAGLFHLSTFVVFIFCAQATSIHVNPLYLMLPVTVAASFAFMLPVATPPNAIVFAYGQMKILDMVKLPVDYFWFLSNWPTFLELFITVIIVGAAMFIGRPTTSIRTMKDNVNISQIPSASQCNDNVSSGIVTRVN